MRRASPIPRDRSGLWDAETERLLLGTGLVAAFQASDAFAMRGCGNGLVALEWTALDRSGLQRSVRIDLDAEGRAAECARPFVHWSAIPMARSHVVVAPDILTFIALRHASRTESIFPFVVVTPVGGLPADWSDLRYWEFDRVTVLSNGLAAPSRIVRLLADRRVPHVGVIAPPGGDTWLRWAVGRACVGHDDLSALETTALPVGAFDHVRIRRRDGADWLRRTCRMADAEGRLCRVATVEGPQPSDVALLVVRSDRTSAVVSTSAASGGLNARSADWTAAAAAAFLDGAAPPSPEDVGRMLHGLLAPVVGGGRSLRILSAFVALTYVHQAAEELPVVLVRGGSASERLALRRLLAAVCHGAVVASRCRAMQLARILDAGDGTLLLDEPGPLCGPSGPTEFGRLLADGAVRGASAYTRVSDRHGLRTLDVFGPKLVLTAAGTAAGLAVAVETLDLATSGAIAADVHPPVAVQAARDALYAWAMCFHASGRGVKAPDGLLEMLAEELHGAEQDQPGDGLPTVGLQPVRQAEPTPMDEMDVVLDVVGSGGYAAMIQVMLEIAVRGGDPATFSPERVGRRIATHRRIDAAAPVERRRLLGQISRIYPLADVGRERDAASAFRFCLDRGCGECRYDKVCESVAPALRKRKRSL